MSLPYYQLTSTCNVERFTSNTRDELNNPIKTWTTLHTSLPCKLGSVTKKEIDDNNKSQIVRQEPMLYLNGDPDIQTYDRVLIDSIYYGILEVNKPTNTVGVGHTECVIQTIANP